MNSNLFQFLPVTKIHVCWVSPVPGFFKVLNEDYEAQNISSPQFSKHYHPTQTQ